MASLSELEVRLLADRLHVRGPAVLFHMLAEIVHGANPAASIRKYADLDDELTIALGGKLPPRLRSIKGGRP
jgi:hypothetical protein